MRCSEDSSEVDDDLSSTDYNSDDSESDDNLSAKEDAIDINDIHVGDFAVVKYKYARSVKYYVGECMKDGNEKIIFIFLERDSGTLFKNRENVIEESAELNMVKHILTPPSATRRGGKLDFKSSKETIDNLLFLY